MQVKRKWPWPWVFTYTIVDYGVHIHQFRISYFSSANLKKLSCYQRFLYNRFLNGFQAMLHMIFSRCYFRLQLPSIYLFSSFFFYGLLWSSVNQCQKNWRSCCHALLSSRICCKVGKNNNNLKNYSWFHDYLLTKLLKVSRKYIYRKYM